ncbi:MAG: hypothetical protein KF878_33145 [Planctomycetes bacterium]|nr:hypothetical protein [Planctomycetota bacterium]
MSRGLRALALALLALTSAGPVHAQDTPWWERPEAREEARRTLAQVRSLMEATERGDPRPAAAALQDRAWIVRSIAVIRLEVLGLDAGTTEALREQADPTRPAPEDDSKPLRRAREFAAALEVDLGPPVEVPPREAARIAASILTERVKGGPPDEDAAAKRRLVEHLLAWRAVVPEKADRAWLARRLLGLTDIDQALDDLKAQTAARAVGEDGDAVFTWYRSNAPYLYWHPRERRLRVDVAARVARQPTAEFRRATPWGPEEGPNAPPRETDAQR